tara:strand:+ start:506 stop:727 length:222 start_codon:yes stop_codon:yes gene_type:complete
MEELDKTIEMIRTSLIRDVKEYDAEIERIEHAIMLHKEEVVQLKKDKKNHIKDTEEILDSQERIKFSIRLKQI